MPCSHRQEQLKDLLMTLNKRLATAAAAIVHKIINRSRPRVFRPVSPLKKGSMEAILLIGLGPGYYIERNGEESLW